METDQIMQQIELVLKRDEQVSLKEATVQQLHAALASVVMGAIADPWYESRHAHERTRSTYYLSAEYLVGRMVYNNLFALGILDEVKKEFAERGLDLAAFEDIEDAALGNGGLGRLAACFLDSAATMNLPLDGYGIRYKYGLFKQTFTNGFQTESADDWQRFGDPWSRRRDTHEVLVHFSDQTVRAVPYDMPIIGYHSDNIGTLRLWQSEAVQDFDFEKFNNQEYAVAVLEKNAVEDITRVLYPNDTTTAGKRLRLKQQYFLSSASLQDLMFRFKRENRPITEFADLVSIQLNDTHPTVSIPELIRLLMLEGLGFDEAFEITRKTFSYTNHTVMQEALEKWDVNLFRDLLPEIFDIIYRINTKLCGEIMAKGLDCEPYAIVSNNIIRMANLAVYVSSYVNGVAEIHTQILKDDVLKCWYQLYPERFQNKTNGITQRRWLGLCNPELSKYITDRIGGGWITDLEQLQGLKAHMSDADVDEFIAIKREKKRQLREIIRAREGVDLPESFCFDVQVKRMHEYKRQLLNAFAILDLYFGVKDGRIKNFTPTAFIFGAKAAPGYLRAKAVIKFINEIAKKINNDPDVKDLMRVVFVHNYNCSYAEHIIPAADISEQISPAGTEASGTGNMKLMLNGAVTLGTPDGANIEIARAAGYENNYIFGADVEKIRAIADSYDPRRIYEEDRRINRALNTLVDGTVPTDEGQRELFDSLIYGADWHRADCYYLLLDFGQYRDARLRALYDWRDRRAFGRKALNNISAAGIFSSDRSVRQYAENIWHI